MGLDSHVELLVAALDLKLVQLLRDAIRTTDLSGARENGNLAPEVRIEQRRHIHPEPLIEPRRHIHPEPRYEPRPVIHPTPRVEPSPPVCLPAEVRRAHKSGLVPPWKVLPWENPPQPSQKVKVIKIKPDIVRKGSLIDCFI